MAAGRLAQGRKGSCSHFFSILHCKMKKKWAVIFAATIGAPGAAHFFSILQCKMVKKWPQDGSPKAAKGPAAIFSPFYTVKWRKNGP